MAKPKTAGQYTAMIWKQAWSKALAEARLATWAFGIVIGIAVLVASIDSDTRNLVTLEITLAALFGILVYRICSVSYHSYTTLEAKGIQLNEQLIDKINHQELADELTVQHEKGKQLIKSPAHLRDAVAEDASLEKWVSDTLEIMRRHGCSVQEIHQVESVTIIDLREEASRFTGKAKFVFERTQRIAAIAAEYAKIARELGLAARKKNS